MPFDVFDKQQIVSRVNGDKEQQKKALQQYENAIKKFRKENDPKAAIELFNSSIESYPTAKAFFELGNAFASTKYYESALKCYAIAEQMGFYPASRVFYNTACAYSLLDRTDEARKYLEYAIEAGYLNKRQIAGDSDLNNLRKYSSLKDLMASVLQGVENPESVEWESFTESFASVVLPMTLDFNTERQLNPDKYLWQTYELYISEMHDREVFSRGTGHVYYAVANIEQNKDFVALVYAEGNDESMGNSLPPLYFLASYDKKGTLIDKMLVAGQQSVEDSFRVCMINPNLSMEIRYFANTYNTVADMYGDDSLVLEHSEPRGVQYYTMTAGGKFMETSPPIGSINAEQSMPGNRP